MARGIASQRDTAVAIDKLMDGPVGMQWGSRALVALRAEPGVDGDGSPYSPFTPGEGTGGDVAHPTFLPAAYTLIENPTSGRVASIFRTALERDIRLVKKGYNGDMHEQVRMFLLGSPLHSRRALLNAHQVVTRAKQILANLEAATQPPRPSATSESASSARAIEEALGKLSVMAKQVDELKHGGIAGQATLQLADRLNDLEATVNKLAGARDAVDSATPRNLADAIAAAAALSHAGGPPSASSSAMPALSSWCDVAPPPGLEVQARTPDYHTAWRSRPADGPMGKSARKELAARLHADALLQGLPVLGDTTSYGKMRATLLENWFLYSYVIYNGDAGQATLLRGLRACATTRLNTTRDSRWEALTTVGSVLEFLNELDILFRDPHHSATESCWAAAKRDATSTLDYFRRLRPLMRSGESRTRARNALVEHLAARNERDCIVALQRCPLDQVDAWREVLETYHAAEAKVSAMQQPKASSRGGGKTLAAIHSFSSSDSSTAMQAQGRLAVSTDLTVSQAAALLNHLLNDVVAESTAAGKSVQPQLLAAVTRAVSQMTGGGSAPPSGGPDAGELAALSQEQDGAAAPSASETALAAVLAAINQASQPTPSGGTIAGFNRGPVMIYDLAKVYSYLGLDPVPERRGPHMLGTHGKECLVCSSLMGFKEFAPHNDLKSKGYPEGSRALHNAYWCKYVPEVVMAKAKEKGTSPEEVTALLTKQPDASTAARRA